MQVRPFMDVVDKKMSFLRRSRSWNSLFSVFSDATVPFLGSMRKTVNPIDGGVTMAKSGSFEMRSVKYLPRSTN
jgi:hypothetical protein